MRIPGVCNFDPETTVFAHLNGAGIGKKHADLFGCYACSNCHAWLDGGYVQASASSHERDYTHLKAMQETQQKLLDKGLIKL